MKRLLLFLIILATGLWALSCELLNNDSGVPINEDIWVNAYLASWQHDPETRPGTDTKIKTSEIDWDAMTHMTYFSLSIAEDGTPSQSLDSLGNFNSERLNSIVPAAHANDKDILFSVGGGSNYEGFSVAVKGPNRETFISTIREIMTDYGFDGVSLSPPAFISDSTKTTFENERDYINYQANFRAFVIQLHESLSGFKTKREQKPLLTISALKDAELISLYSELQLYFDQINILTYDMAQPWRGWQAWHNSALQNKNEVFEDNQNLKFPSIDDKVNEFIAAGIDRKKLGIAINFYGAYWDGVKLFGKWPTWPTQELSIYNSLSYSEMDHTFNLDAANWDRNALVPYLDLNNPARFVSFENDESIKEKVMYAKKKRIGGIMIWELGGGFFPERSGEKSQPLLKSVKKYAFSEN